MIMTLGQRVPSGGKRLGSYNFLCPGRKGILKKRETKNNHYLLGKLASPIYARIRGIGGVPIRARPQKSRGALGEV